jgi:hypothetical protein
MSTHKDALPFTRSLLVQLEKRINQLETCSKAPSLINSKLYLANLLDTIMNIPKKVMNADACSLLIVDEATCVSQSS